MPWLQHDLPDSTVIKGWFHTPWKAVSSWAQAHLEHSWTIRLILYHQTTITSPNIIYIWSYHEFGQKIAGLIHPSVQDGPSIQGNGAIHPAMRQSLGCMALRVGLAQTKAAGRWHHRALPALPAVPHLHAKIVRGNLQLVSFDGIGSQYME